MGYDNSTNRGRLVLEHEIPHVTKDLTNNPGVRFSSFQFNNNRFARLVLTEDIDKAGAYSSFSTIIYDVEAGLQQIHVSSEGRLHVPFKGELLLFDGRFKYFQW